MSWRDKEDLGTQLVAHVHESLRIPGDYSLDRDRGFEWWASDYCQRVWSDLGNFHNASTVYRLHAEIDFLQANGHFEEAKPAFAAAMAEGSLNAIVYDPEKDLIKLHSSIYGQDENVNWVHRVFNAVIALQICEVHRMAQRFAHDFKMSHAMTEHPTKGGRKAPDPICEFEERFFKPYGANESRWVGVEEWDEGRQALRRISKDLKTDYKLCLDATFDWNYGHRDMALLVSAVDPHPILGNGLLFALTTPVMMEDALKSQVAMMLNEHERKDWNWYNDLGTWCLLDGELTFFSFVPNVCYVEGILRDFCHDMGLRANWVNEHWAEFVRTDWMHG